MSGRPLLVTGHPNHELAVLGWVQRVRPNLLFLTDGGGPHREQDSRDALASLGLAGQATSLGGSESLLYQALLDHDTAPLVRIAAAIRTHVERLRPRQVLCEAIEFYNPLHDLTLPLVVAALRGLDVEIVEFPLIAQVPDAEERYRIQRFAPGREAVTRLELDRCELGRKLTARAAAYPSLRAQLGATIAAVSDADCGLEVLARAGDPLAAPNENFVVRYEWRGRHLREAGAVTRVITYRDHFRPGVAGLLAEGGP